MNEEEIKRNFAKNIRDLRLSRDLNQVQLGEKIHYTSKAISKWENGDVMPDIVTLKMLADFFTITVDDLISNKNVVRKSHRKRNRALIVASSVLLSFFIGSLVFLVLYFCSVPGSWKAFTVALVTSSITMIVFASLWYKGLVLNLSVSTLIASIALMVMCFMDFAYFWVILVSALILIAASSIFFNIRFPGVKNDK